MSVTLNSFLWQSMKRRSGRLSKTLSLNFSFCFLNNNPHFDWKQMFAKEWSYSNSRSASVLRRDMWLSPYNPLKTPSAQHRREKKLWKYVQLQHVIHARLKREVPLFVSVLAAGAPVMTHSQELPSSFLPRERRSVSENICCRTTGQSFWQSGAAPELRVCMNHTSETWVLSMLLNWVWG